MPAAWQVPTEVVATVVEEFLAIEEAQFDQDDESGLLWPRTALAMRSGVDSKTLAVVLKRERSTISFSIADKLISTGCGKPHLWNEEPLLTFYWDGSPPPDLSKPIKCECRTCDEWFSADLVPHATFGDGTSWITDQRRKPRGPNDGLRLTTKRFCSHACEQRESGYRRGDHIPRSDTHFRCGHEKSPENTETFPKLYKGERRTYTRCVTCRRASVAAARKKAA